MIVQQQILLRYRSAGHLRFELPLALCAPAVAPLIEGELHRIEGVYRVLLYRGQRKLSIRFFDTVTDVPQVAREMYRILDDLVDEGLVKPHAARRPPPRTQVRHKARPLRDRLRGSRLGIWIRAKVQEGKETAGAIKVLAKGRMKNAPAFLQDPEKAAFEFANDVLVFYLIKTHWHRILYQWLPNPVRHRYEWLAVIYLTYLWVHSRHKGR